MKCKRPFVKEGLSFGCGCCIPCRINKRRLWTLRILLESFEQPDNAFVTLTYDDEICKKKNLDCSELNPEHSRNFIKRLRKAVAPDTIRYYLVGEYGDATARPHYHAILFNFPSCEFGRPMVFNRQGCQCRNCRCLSRAWGLGISYNGQVTTESAQYVAQYVTKKFNKSGDIIMGRHPEFNRMSNRPGIGATAIDKLTDLGSNEYFRMSRIQHGDVPDSLHFNGKDWPIGTYLKKRWRKNEGLPEETPDIIKQRMLFEDAKKVEHYVQRYGFKAGQKMEDHRLQTARNIESRAKLFNKRTL